MQIHTFRLDEGKAQETMKKDQNQQDPGLFQGLGHIAGGVLGGAGHVVGRVLGGAHQAVGGVLHGAATILGGKNVNFI